MSEKPTLVVYRRTSSDMDLSSSEEDKDATTDSILLNKGSELLAQCNVSTRDDLSEQVRNRKEDRLQDIGKSSKLRDDDHDNDDKLSKTKYEDKDRRSRRREKPESKSRDRSRSNSPHRRKRRSRDRSRGRSPYSRHRSPSYRDRKRSHSPEHYRRKYKRNSRSPETFRSKRLERKAARIDKLGLELYAEPKPGLGPGRPSLAGYCNSGAASRLTEQIQKRRLLWSANKKEAPVSGTVEESPGTSKAWEAATFKGDNDGKMTEKFKRLMGIKSEAAGAGTPGSSLIQKQEEMFSNMEAQYQVARMATHTHRGVGLGFGTFQVPPR